MLARQGNHTTLLASGYGNLKQKTRLRTSDRFRVGSITKTFVATLVLQLVGEGKLSLDDTVEQRLPGVIPHGQVDHHPTAAQHDQRPVRLPQRRRHHRRRQAAGRPAHLPLVAARADRDLEQAQAALRTRLRMGVLQHLLRPARADRREADRASARSRAEAPHLRARRSHRDKLRHRAADRRRPRPRLRTARQAAAHGRQHASARRTAGPPAPSSRTRTTSPASTARSTAGSSSVPHS